MEPMKADRTEQEKLVELSEKLSTHNTTHGKNVVFWSCKKCHPKDLMDFHESDCVMWISNQCWHSYESRYRCQFKDNCDFIVGARVKCSDACKMKAWRKTTNGA